MNPENIGATAKPTECALSESKAIASNCWLDTVKYAAAPRGVGPGCVQRIEAADGILAHVEERHH